MSEKQQQKNRPKLLPFRIGFASPANPRPRRQQFEELARLRRLIDDLQCEFDSRLNDLLACWVDAPELRGGRFPDTINEVVRALAQKDRAE